MSKRLRLPVTGANLAQRVGAYLVAFFIGTAIASGMVRLTVAGSLSLSLQEATPPNAATHKEQNIQSLEIGKPLEQKMWGGETHAYRLTLAAGQSLHAVIDQRGIAVAVTVFAPDGNVLVKVEGPNGTQGPATLWAIADASGDYRLEVSSQEKEAQPGRYEIRIEELRAASQTDRDHVAVEMAYMEAKRLRAQGDQESLQKAIAQYDEALKLCQALADASGEATTLYSIGEVYFSLNNAQKAFEYYNKTLLILRSVDDRPILAAALNGIGTLYDLASNLEKALGYYEQARQIFHALHDYVDEATLLNNLGHAHEELGQQEKALTCYNEALAILQSHPHHPTLPVIIGNIGYLYYLRNQPQQALAYYERALKEFQKREDLSGQAKTLNNMGQAYGAIGRNQAALQFYKRARLIFHQLGDRSHEIATLGNIATLYESSGHKQEALASYQQAIDKFETLRASTTIEEIRAGFSQQSGFVYKAGLLLMSLRRDVEVFNLTERARARTFLDRIGNIRPNLLKTTNVQLIKEREELESRLTSLEQRREQEDGEPPPALETEYADAQRQYENLLLRLQLDNPDYASLRSVETLNLAEVQRHLNQDTTLLSYFFGPEKTFAFVITRDSFHAVTISVKATCVINEIGWLRDFPSVDDLPLTTLKRLYDWLIAPISRFIKTPLVGIIPHRELHYLPFAALTDGRHYFGDQHTLFYLPSASALPFIQKQRKPVGAQMLALAQSRVARLSLLPHADDEASSVASLYNTQALTTGKALKSEFLKHAGEYSIIHLAAHADIDAASPLFSRIMLAADKQGTAALEVRQIYDLDLAKASLVVLSACQTQLGGRNIGDDIVALNRAFLYAGTPTVIASLWIVDDTSTSDLMKSFYKHLKSGMGKAEALKAAQSDIRKAYPHPYHWAAFVLTGDPGDLPDH